MCTYCGVCGLGKVCFIIRMLFHIVYASEGIEHAAHTAEFDAIGISIMFGCVCCVLTNGKLGERRRRNVGIEETQTAYPKVDQWHFPNFGNAQSTGMKVVTLGILCSRDRKAFFFLGARSFHMRHTIPQHTLTQHNEYECDICHKFGFDLVLKMDKFMKIVAWLRFYCLCQCVQPFPPIRCG